jgi:hypothetical protein
MPHPALRKQVVPLESSETDVFATTYSIPTVESGFSIERSCNKPPGVPACADANGDRQHATLTALSNNLGSRVRRAMANGVVRQK